MVLLKFISLLSKLVLLTELACVNLAAKFLSSNILSMIKNFIRKFSDFCIKKSCSQETTSTWYFVLSFTSFCIQNRLSH